MREGALAIVVAAFAIASTAGVGRVAARVDDPPLPDTQDGLRIVARAASERVSAREPLNMTVVVENVSERPLTVLSHIATHETHLQWYRFRLEYLAPDSKGRCDAKHARHAARDIAIADSLDRSIPVVRSLAAGGSISYTVDLQAWARRKVNGAMRIPPGQYQVRVVYRVTTRDARFASDKQKVWMGAVESPSAPITVTGPVAAHSCPPANNAR